MRGLLGTCWFRKFIQNLAGCRRDGTVTILDGAVWTSGCQREWDWQPIPSRGLTSGCQSRLLACVALLRSPLDGLAIGSRGHLDGTVTILDDFQSGSTSVSHPAAKKKVPTKASANKDPIDNKHEAHLTGPAENSPGASGMIVYMLEGYIIQLNRQGIHVWYRFHV